MRLFIKELKFDKNQIEIYLNNDESFNLPKYYTKKIKEANFNDLLSYRLIGNGEGIHFDKIDEDISLEGLIQDLNIF